MFQSEAICNVLLTESGIEYLNLTARLPPNNFRSHLNNLLPSPSGDGQC
jgi:hypothetical protein